jgi:hypothetical protein
VELRGEVTRASRAALESWLEPDGHLAAVSTRLRDIDSAPGFALSSV